MFHDTVPPVLLQFLQIFAAGPSGCLEKLIQAIFKVFIFSAFS